MKTSKLPPELVEKFLPVIHGVGVNYLPIEESMERCAQIAVDYRESEIAVLETDKAMLESELHSVKQQRDELIDLLEETELHIEYLNSKFKETGTGNSLLSRIKANLKKHESKPTCPECTYPLFSKLHDGFIRCEGCDYKELKKHEDGKE